MKKFSLSKLTPFLSLAFFGLALWLLHGELKGFRYRDVISFFGALPASRVALAVAFTIAGYFALTGYDTLAIRYIGKEVAYWKIALASFAGYAFSNTLGMPLFTGTPLRARLYSGWGLTALDIARIVVLSYATFWLGFLGLAGASFLLEPIAVPARLHLPVASAWPVGVVFLSIVAAYLAATILRRRPLAVKGLELAIPRPSMALMQIGVASLDWSLAGAVLYALLPDSWNITPFHFLGVFLFAQVAGLLSHVPGGLGVFESMMVLLLPELPHPQLLAAMVAYRAVYYFMPLLVAAATLGVHEVVRRRKQVGRLARMFGGRAPDVVPQILAVTTFLGGAILLVSGATPAVHSRLSWLKDALPLSVIEASHFVGSLAGVLLMFLAIGLQRRLDAAYQLTVVLLATGTVVSLAKGLDYEEAIVLAIMLAALLPCHSHFNRKASLTAEPFTPGWSLAISIVLLGSVWLGFFAYKHVDYSRELWWHFTLFGNAPRFLRASVGVVAVALGVAVSRLLRTAPMEPSTPTEDELGKAAAVAAAFPRTYSWLALIGDKQLLFHDSGKAFVMFGVEHRTWVSMGDPVGPDRERAELVWKFRELADRHHGWTCFYQVNDKSLHLYADLGLTLIKLGEEARVPLTTFSLAGSSRKKLRWAQRKCTEEGCRFEVLTVEQAAPLLPELERISDEWLEHKNTREKAFSLGYFNQNYLRRFPLALIYRGDKIVAFANLWLGGEKEEISIDLMRHTADAPTGVMDYLFVELMLYGTAQGYRWFNLGMAPLSGLEARTIAPLWSRLGAMVFRHGEHFYNFQGLRQYKDKFEPVWESRYLACPGGLALPRVLGDIATLISRGFRGVVAK
ncbi:MAG TPA: bifunctional lysylphosphatidylglycerol flippase/synthetase MprF [Thermoanaerobaculia bacterium]|jgi:phosphatidylglycerol lysyltransferase|nr:bifunctional lysylphosphatidylglycerol flippase/synthetase MprF [Thermoanaerobaculia bacterium]